MGKFKIGEQVLIFRLPKDIHMRLSWISYHMDQGVGNYAQVIVLNKVFYLLNNGDSNVWENYWYPEHTLINVRKNKLRKILKLK